MRRKVSSLLAAAMVLTVAVPAAADHDLSPEDRESLSLTTGTGDPHEPDDPSPGPPDAVQPPPDQGPAEGAPHPPHGDPQPDVDVQGSPQEDGHEDRSDDGIATTAGTAPGTRPTTSACEPAPRSTFRDRSTAGVHTAAVDCVAWWSVTGGFPDGTYRPAGTVTRGQMASFITDAILATGGNLPSPGAGFSDTTSTVHRRPIARLASAGIVGGFTDGRFRPEEPVTRGQMASFLTGALDHLEVTPPELTDAADHTGFLDVAGTTHEATILFARDAGIAGGFDDGTYRPGDAVTRAQMATFLARLLATVTDAGAEVRAAKAAMDGATLRTEVCRSSDGDVERAQPLLAGRYRFLPHPEVTLGTDLTWAEDPLNDNNWRFQLHTLRWMWPLMSASSQTGDLSYLHHATQLARSWVDRNPIDAPPSDYSWNDHSTAWRAMVLGCLAMHATPPDWLLASMQQHRDVLADPGFYVDDGNHALNQDTGLLTLACLTDAWDLRDLAAERIARLATTSVDAQGVNNEQAVEYQDYNYERYLAAMQAIEACGLPTPGWADRLDRMPVVLAHMTQPDGRYVTLGDTDRRRAKFAFEHPAMRWMSTGGDSGEPPAETFVTFDAGFTFARSGWGTDRPRLDENYLSVRHGEPRRFHGHPDHGSITLFAEGQQLLTDPGKYAYGNTAERAHVVSQRAHNLITLGDNCPPPSNAHSPVTNVASDEHVDRLTVRVATCPGTAWTRTIGFVRDTGEVIVVDEVAAPTTSPVVQHWQLEPGASVERIGPSLTFASWGSGATLAIEQLEAVASTTSVTGGRSPLRGWVSEHYSELTPAANIEVTARSATSRTFVTVLRPGARGGASPSSLERTSSTTRVSLTTADDRALTVELPRVRP